MRIYEVAKKYSKSSKELIDVLKVEGFPVVTHMSVLGEKELLFLEQLFEKKESVSVEKTSHDGLKKNKNSENLTKNDQSVLSLSMPVTQNTKNISPQARKEQTDMSNKPSTEGVHQPVISQVLHKVLVVEPMNVESFAEKAKITVNDIIIQLLRWGIVITKNQILKEDLVVRLANHYTIAIEKPLSKQDLVAHENQAQEKFQAHKNSPSANEKRSPVVVVIGHVDHGKTTLLDFIRKTRVAAKEKGGITQHIGAHEVTTSHGSIVFIDTPGHEAFTKIRQRGIRVADIAILVIAADDGVMPQTIEAIKQAKSMHLSIIVAINKIDRVAPERIEIVKKQLIQYDIIPEDWGGDVICVPISAKLGKGVDQLLDMIALQAEMMELKTNTAVPATGYVLETKMERGRGAVATVLCHSGILKLGNFFIAGTVTGHVTSMINSVGKPVQQALPTVPVQIAGFDGMPEIGELFKVITKDEYAGFKTENGQQQKHTVVHTLFQNGAINLILKTDTDSSKEAVLDFVTTLNKKSKKQFNVVSAGIGVLNESDIEFAYNVTAQVIVLHARVDPKALMLASVRKITIHHFDIIYKMTDFLKEWLAAQSNETVVVRKKIGQAEVLRVFDIKGIGLIAGSVVKDGRFVKDGIVVALRNGKKIGEGKIVGLQRERKTVKEVHTGFECGFMVEDILDWQVGDIAECYVNQTEVRQL